MRKIFIYTLLLLYPLIGYTQAEGQFLVASSGGSERDSKLCIDWSVGEVSGISNSEGSCQMSDGFQQPCYKIEETTALTNKQLGIKMFPVPATDFIQLEFADFNDEALNIQIYNLAGVEVISKKVSTNVTQIELSHLPAGEYILKVIKNKQIISSNTIIKY